MLSGLHIVSAGRAKIDKKDNSPLLDHDAHDFIQGVSSRHGSMLSVCVVGRLRRVLNLSVTLVASALSLTYRNFDNIRRDQINPIKPPKNRSQLSRRPASRFRCTCCRGNCAMSHHVSYQLVSFFSWRYGQANSQAGSSVSISKDKYTGFLVPTRSRIFLMMPSVPIVSISRASTISNPQYPSFS